MRMTCGICHGTAEVRSGVPCPQCGGSGSVSVVAPAQQAANSAMVPCKHVCHCGNEIDTDECYKCKSGY